MARVLHPDVLEGTYRTITKQIAARNIPTVPLYIGQTVFRSVKAVHLPKPAAGGHPSKNNAIQVLIPRDGTEGYNRFSGPSYNTLIPSAAGLYCVLQQQALVNEVMYYARKGGLEKASTPGMTFADAALRDKCVVKLMLIRRMQVGDLSPHNPGMSAFVEAVEHAGGFLDQLKKAYGAAARFWDCLTDSDDCSVARGVGLAVAHSRYMDGLSVRTVRMSDRSAEEQGDNLVFFGSPTAPIGGLKVTEMYYFQTRGKVEVFQMDPRN
jgi:hypothetical protein